MSMTELEKTKLAKTYIEKLSYGINPLDNMPIADEELINNVHISRCLMFVAELLGKVADNGGLERSQKGKKKPFSISFEQREQFEFSTSPITISEVARRLNAAAGERGDCCQIRYSSIAFWLIEMDVLRVEKRADGREVKIPTDRGRAVGISVQEREGANGKYNVVVYDEDAQHFILDNIDAIIDAEHLRFQKQGQPWTAEDDALLLRLMDEKEPLYDISLQLKRNVASIRSRLKKLGIEIPSNKQE